MNGKMLEVKVKRLTDDAVVPSYAHGTDAGLDLTAISNEVDEYGNVVYHTGLAFEIPEGYVGLLFPRSSICKTCLSLTNCVGVIDSGYRGEIMAKFKRNEAKNLLPFYKNGERMIQLIVMPYPKVKIIETNNLSESERGTGGYGSTGK